MSDKQLINYQSVHCKIKWKYTTTLQDGFEIIKLTDIVKEDGYCYGTDQYIKNFIEIMKERVIRNLPKLEKVKIFLGVFDKNNLFHRIAITVYHMMAKILKRQEKKINFYKSIIVIIKYEDEEVFMGSLSFDGL
jgi:hypothetical protein